MRLAVAQAPVKLGNIETNLAQANGLAGLACEAGDGKLDLLVLPELFLTGYMLRDDLSRLAEPLPPLPATISLVAGEDAMKTARGSGEVGTFGFTHKQPVGASDFPFGPAMAGLLELSAAKGCFIVCGHVERDGRGLYNTAVMVGPAGYIGHYRKVRLPHTGPFEEPTYFGFGSDRQQPLFDLPFGTVGLQVCYDIHFPLPSLKLAMAGAQLICNLSAAPNTSRYVFERLLPGRAIETSCYWAYANNVGFQENLTFWGGSRVLSPRGDVLATCPDQADPSPGVATVELDLADVASVRDFRPTLKDGAGDELEL